MSVESARAILDEEAAAALQLLDLQEFATQPKSRWLVRGILPPDSLVVVFGPPKGGKTFAATDMLMHAAHGEPAAQPVARDGLGDQGPEAAGGDGLLDRDHGREVGEQLGQGG